MPALFNHAQISVEESLLSADNLQSLESFLGKVIGFRRIVGPHEPGSILFGGEERTQYLVLTADSNGAALGNDDHIGFFTEDADEYRRMQEAAFAFATEDQRLDVEYFPPEGKNGAFAEGIRMRYILPFAIEVALHTFEDADPRHLFSRMYED